MVGSSARSTEREPDFSSQLSCKWRGVVVWLSQQCWGAETWGSQGLARQLGYPLSELQVQ